MLRRTLLSFALVMGIVGISGCSERDNLVEVRLTNLESNTVSVPAGVDAATVTISDISFHPSATAGENDVGWVSLPLNQSIDLLTLAFEKPFRLLGTVYLEPGTYEQVRVTVSDVKVTVGGEDIQAAIIDGVATADLPQGAPTIVKGSDYGMQIDINAAASITNLGGGNWQMTVPVVSVKDVYTVAKEDFPSPI